MTEYKDEQYNLEEIPDFALQPAREPEKSPSAELGEEKGKIPSAEVFRQVFPELPPAEKIPSEREGSPEGESLRLVSAKESFQEKKISLVRLQKRPQLCFQVEEDILIPDSKPDLEKVLSAEGLAQLDESGVYAGKTGLRFAKVSGSLRLRLLYQAQGASGTEALVSVGTGIPFREDLEVNASPEAELSLFPKVRQLECSVINERKLRIRAQLCLDICEYVPCELSFLQGSSDPGMKCRTETAVMTGIFSRKREASDLREILSLGEGMPEVGEILFCDVRLGALSRQTDREKVAVNIPVHYQILYRRGEDEFPGAEEEGTSLLQGRLDFTQFLSSGREADTEPAWDCLVRCRLCDFLAEPTLDPSGRQTQILLSLTTETTADFYGTVKQENITDLYHMDREVLFDRDFAEGMQILGEVQGEGTCREILSLSGGGSDAGNVLLLRGWPQEVSFEAEKGKVVGKGTIKVHLVYGAPGGASLYSQDQEIPFRCELMSGESTEESSVMGQVFLKDLRFDRINGKQLELNASLGFSGVLLKKESYPLLRNVNLSEGAEEKRDRPSLAVYIAREGDDLWSVSKKYGGDPEVLCQVNSLSAEDRFSEGDRILILR